MAEQPGASAGKYMSTVKIGPKGQIVIPKEIRQRCNLQPGESLVLAAGKGNSFMAHPLSGCREVLSQLLEQLPEESDDGEASI